MGLIVQKFGGSSVKDAESIARVAKTVVADYDAGNNVVVVVSAQGDTTDELLEKAYEISQKPGPRELDFLLATGEQISAALLCMAIRELRRPVVPLTGWQAGFLTSSTHGKARVRSIRPDRLRNELDNRNIVVVTGFQGMNRYDDLTTLGRGGSDTTAVAIAAAFGADKCKIFTDVEGIYTADPRVVPGAQKLHDISYDEMLELASLGAKVLHSRSVEMAKKYSVPLEIRSSLEDVEGTTVREVGQVEKMVIKGITRDDAVTRITVTDLADQPGMAFRLFSALAKADVNVDIILQTLGREGKKDISFTVHDEDSEKAVAAIEGNKDFIDYGRLLYDNNISKVSAVGSGMESNPGVAAMVFEALADAGINIHMISTSEIKLSVMVDRDTSERAVRAIHLAFEQLL